MKHSQKLLGLLKRQGATLPEYWGHDFYGQITIQFQAGKPVLIREETTTKIPEQLKKS